MPVPAIRRAFSYQSLIQPPSEQWDEPVRRSESQPDVNVIARFPRRSAHKLRKRWLQELYVGLSPREIEKMIRRKRRAEKERKKEGEGSVSYKYGRLAMIALALFSIPIDGWKLYQGIARTERALDGPTSIEVFDYYSSAITTHVIGLAGAMDNSLMLTIGCRMLSTILYQTSYGTKGNSSVPTDPKELQKYIRENVPAHRLPKGYRFNDDLDSSKAGNKAGKRRRGSKANKKSKTRTAKSKKAAKTKKSASKSRHNKKKKKAKSGQRDNGHNKKADQKP